MASQRARKDYEAALAERDARIAELEGQIAETAKTAESAEKLRAEMDELRSRGEEQRVSFELTMAGARNVKAAMALLPDYGNDIDKLKEAEPWLFSASAPTPTGATGRPNAGAATDAGATLKRCVFSQVLLSEKSAPFFRVSSRKFFGFRRGHAANFLTCPA